MKKRPSREQCYSSSIFRRILPTAIATLILTTLWVSAQTPARAVDEPLTIAGTDVKAVLKLLGAKMEEGLTLQRLEDYTGHFDRRTIPPLR